jgi:class 3 adenylate cyclase
MRVRAPFPLKKKALLATAGILVPVLAALNFITWYYGLYPSLGSLAAGLGGITTAIDWGVFGAYQFWIENIALSVALLLIGLATASACAQAAARRIVSLIDAAESFENGRFDVPLGTRRGKMTALERSVARLGDSLAMMLKFINKNVVCLAKKNTFSLSAESPSVTVAVFRIDNYHTLARYINPKQMNELVNDYLARIIPSITKTGGALNKIWTIDDFYTLAVWGSLSLTSNVKNDAAGALRACVLVRSAVKTMNRDMRILAERAGYRKCPQFKVSMGVDSGEALIGPIGTNEQKEYCIVGDVVQNALDCACIGAKTGKQIVMTERTFELGGSHFSTRKLPGDGIPVFSLIKPIIGVEYVS